MKPYAALLAALILLFVGSTLARAAEPAPPASQADVKATTQPAKTLELDLGDKVTIKLIQIPAGKFLMGSPKGEKDRSDNEVQRQVTIAKPFFMGIYLVTQDQYQAVAGNNPSSMKGAGKPVETVSWDDAVAFCKKASAKTGRQFRLPTEAEWEYACRAGTKTAYFCGDDDKQLEDYSWYSTKGPAKGSGTHPVGQKKPNPWGLYDMVGHLGQWCDDAFTGPFPKGAKGPEPKNLRVHRGGFWDLGSEACRSAKRFWLGGGARNFYVGFRVVVSGAAGD
jgi:formylglycine-generating enzyme required for sulfatase activity